MKKLAVLMAAMMLLIAGCASNQAPVQEGTTSDPAQQEQTQEQPQQDQNQQNQQAQQDQNQQNQNVITEAKAKQIALSDAGVKEADTQYLNVHLDYDDGMQQYEVSFFSGTTEYEYTLNAANGQILEKDAENQAAGYDD